MLCHAITTNWRQRFTTARERMGNLDACLEYKVAGSRSISLSIDQILKLGTEGLTKTCGETYSGSVMSMTSLVKKGTAHIPMINLHPNEGVMISDIVAYVQRIYPGKRGYLLSSGRHFHYYGDFLVDEMGWREMLGYFLIAYDFVHPGYCGFRLFDGYSTLRLTAKSPHKPHVPKVVAII